MKIKTFYIFQLHFSCENKDKKFVQKLIKQIKEGRKVLHIVDDKDGTPTYTHDFAKNCKALIESKHRGLFNMVCGGLTSRYEVADELISLLNLTDEINLEKVSSEYFKEEYFAQRPDCERLVNKKLDDLSMNMKNITYYQNTITNLTFSTIQIQYQSFQT